MTFNSIQYKLLSLDKIILDLTNISLFLLKHRDVKFRSIFTELKHFKMPAYITIIPETMCGKYETKYSGE